MSTETSRPNPEALLRRWGWRLMPDGLWLDSQGKYRLTLRAALARVERDEARGDEPEADFACEECADGRP